LNRRTFIALIASTAAVPYPLNILAERRLQPASVTALDEPWKTIAAVQQHLFPAEEDSPGAEDIQALAYLQNMLTAADISASEREHISNGAGWLNDLSIKIYQRKFIQLDASSREKILRKIEQSRAGSRWLSLLMTYLIEALLSDPVYGGNKNSTGWKWLEHKPGFPTPTADKKYFNLGHIVKRRIKA
jgi:gluconate 2-dehydrogenase gamma chain